MQLNSASKLAFRAADFNTLTEALDYAAQGDNGANFYSGHGMVQDALSYKALREDAVALAKKLLKLGLSRNDRVAMVAETDAHFLRFFFASLYAGLIPVALPASVKLGGHTAYTSQLRRLLEASHATVAVSSEGYLSFLREASSGLDLRLVGCPDDFYALPSAPEQALPVIAADDIAYLQYTSGSTRFPRGVIIKHATAMSNLRGITVHGLRLTAEDRFMSWLPFYHDMGLVGFVLVPVAAQLSVNYLDTRDFAMRPRQWLNVMSKTRSTVSFSPSFGYDLCARRLRDNEAEKFDLSHWRVAGIGAEMIRPQTLALFASVLEPAQFNPQAFTACYGMAECTLGVSFSSLETGFTTDTVDVDHLAVQQRVRFVAADVEDGLSRSFVNCGVPLPDHEVVILDEEGRPVEDLQVGVIFVRGPSVMNGYFEQPEETRKVLSEDGWLNTGDIGYFNQGVLTITGRKKDLIIIHGRNIWPQDLEHLAETQPEVRVGDALAFSVPGHDGKESCVLLIQSRETQPNRRLSLIKRVTDLLQTELNLECRVELVPARSLPKTSSGKPSRARARLDFIAAENAALRDAARGVQALASA